MKDFEDTDREGTAMDSRKPLTAGEIERLRGIPRGQTRLDPETCWVMYEALPRLLSILTPPPDAAVREAEHFASYAVQAVIDFAHLEREDYPDGMTLEQMREAMQTHLDEVVAQVERRLEAAEARVRELEAQIAASKKNERRWIAKGEEAIAERNAANTALEAIKKHQEIVAGTGAAQMSTTWKIADAHLRSIGSTRAALAAKEAQNG